MGMLRCSQMLRRRWWERDYSRLAHRNPWYENFFALIGTVSGISVTAVIFYWARRFYYSHYNVHGDLITIGLNVDKIVFENIEYPPILIRLALHNALCDENTPFAQPMLAPESLEFEAKQILTELKKLQKEHPAVSLQDLWALAIKKSVAILGGPDLKLLWGRGESERFDDYCKQMAGEEVTQREDLKIVEARVNDCDRDARALKKHLLGKGFTTEELTAMIGLRNVGFHGDEFAARAKNKQDILNEGGDVEVTKQPLRSMNEERTKEEELEQQRRRIHETDNKCGLDPLLFDGDYLSAILDVKWEESKEKKALYKVIKSEQQSGFFGGLFGGSKASDENAPTKKVAECEMVTKTAPKFITSAHPYSGCVTMEGIDVSLLDDPALRGHILRFSRNEARFFNVAAKAIVKLSVMGHKEEELRDETKYS